MDRKYGGELFTMLGFFQDTGLWTRIERPSWQTIFVIVTALLPSTSAIAGEMSAQAQAIWDKYKNDWCESATEVAGYAVEAGKTPKFEAAKNSYRLIELSRDGTVAEIIYPGSMRCNGFPIYMSVTGNAVSHIIVDGEEHRVFGTKPFQISVDANKIDRGENFKIISFIAWWSRSGHCTIRLEGENIETPRECLNIAYYDEDERALVFQGP